MRSTALLAGGVGIASVGLVLAYWGYSGWRPYWGLSRSSFTVTGMVSDGDTAAVEGTVREAVDGTFESPIGQSEGTVAAVWRVDQFNGRGEGRWQTAARGVRSVPFVVDDGSGPVQVAFPDYEDAPTLMGSWRPAVTDGVAVGNLVCEFEELPGVGKVTLDGETPIHVREFVAETDPLDPKPEPMFQLFGVGNTFGDRRYYEETIQVGDDVCVMGAVSRDHSGGPGEITEPQSGHAILSEQDYEDLAGGKLRHGVAIGLGTCLFVAGVALAAVGAGTISLSL